MFKISAIIPAYNAEQTLAFCLSSLKNEELLTEIIVIDDCSSDSTGTIANDNGVTLFSNPVRKGPGYCRNYGIQKAKSPVILFCDADVALSSNTLMSAIVQMTDQPGIGGVQGIYTNYCSLNNATSQYKHYQQLENIQGLGEGAVPLLGTALALVKREIIFKAGGFNDSLTQPSVEDRLLGVKMFELGEPMYLLPEFCGEHRHFYNVGTLLKTEFIRARDEIFFWRKLKKSRIYVNQRKKMVYVAFAVGFFFLFLSAISLYCLWVGLILIFSSIVFNAISMWHIAGFFRFSWLIISTLALCSVLAGASVGLTRVIFDGMCRNFRQGPKL